MQNLNFMAMRTRIRKILQIRTLKQSYKTILNCQLKKNLPNNINADNFDNSMQTFDSFKNKFVFKYSFIRLFFII